MPIPITAITNTTGADNVLATLLSVRNNLVRKLLYVTVTFNQSSTSTATIIFKSRLGTAFDWDIGTIVIAAGTNGFFIPPIEEFLIGEGDDILVSVPAGGAGSLASIAIYTQLS